LGEGKTVYFKCSNCGEVSDHVEKMNNNPAKGGALEGTCIKCKKPFLINKTSMVSEPRTKTIFICSHCKKEFEESIEGKDLINAFPDDGKIIKTDTSCIYCGKQFKITDKTMKTEKL